MGTELQPRTASAFSLLAGLVLTLACSVAGAQFRAIPADAKRGQIRHLQEMQIDLNGRTMQLAPGVQIRDAANRLIVPASIPSGATVRFQLDREGQPARIWVLTPEEIAARDPTP